MYKIEDEVRWLFKKTKLDGKRVDKISNMVEFLCLVKGIKERNVDAAREKAVALR